MSVKEKCLGCSRYFQPEKGDERLCSDCSDELENTVVGSRFLEEDVLGIGLHGNVTSARKSLLDLLTGISDFPNLTSNLLEEESDDKGRIIGHRAKEEIISWGLKKASKLFEGGVSQIWQAMITFHRLEALCATGVGPRCLHLIWSIIEEHSRKTILRQARMVLALIDVPDESPEDEERKQFVDKLSMTRRQVGQYLAIIEKYEGLIAETQLLPANTPEVATRKLADIESAQKAISDLVHRLVVEELLPLYDEKMLRNNLRQALKGLYETYRQNVKILHRIKEKLAKEEKARRPPS